MKFIADSLAFIAVMTSMIQLIQYVILHEQYSEHGGYLGSCFGVGFASSLSWYATVIIIINEGY